MPKTESAKTASTSSNYVIAGLDTDTNNQLLSDWFRIERAHNSPVEGYFTENSFQFDGGWIDVRHWNLSRATESFFVTQSRSYFFDVSLGPRPAVKSALLSVDYGEPTDALTRIVMIPPGQKVRLLASPGRYRTMRCMLDARLVENILQQEAQWQPNSLREAIHISGGEIEWLLMKMYREVVQRELGFSGVIESLAKTLAVEIIRRFELGKTPADNSSTTGGIAPWKMRILKERIHADQLPPNLTELAELCFMTVRHLNRAFKEETGQSLGKYVKAATMDRAHRLLIETELSLKEIAHRLGYATAGSFTHAYTHATGLKPADIRNDRIN